MPGLNASATRPWLTRLWPWLILALAVVPAVWHVVDFEEDIDSEFPTVQRPTFNRRPPAAYRLAEPGDTLDRMAIYMSSFGVALAATGAWLGRGRVGLWPSALGLSLAALWYASTPGPTFDGWHGLGWRAIFDPSAPIGLRLMLAGAAVGLVALIAGSDGLRREHWRALRERGRSLGVNGLLIVALVLVVLRQVEVPGVEPVGYWPRWAFFGGLLAFDLALVRAMPELGPSFRVVRRLGYGVVGVSAWLAMVVGGVWLTWYHRPLERLHAVVPGKVYISAMPTELGLEIAQRRHQFRTIINLFPEDTHQRSDRLPGEQRFVREHGIAYVEGSVKETDSAGFLDRTLALANDPDAWPVLVHCHGCMDRSPAWMGIYRFVVQGRPLDEVLCEIERHRGYRPKASVTLLYNRVLPPRAPERYASDPTAALLRRCARGTPNWPDPPPATADGRRANPTPTGGVSATEAPRAASGSRPGRSPNDNPTPRPSPLRGEGVWRVKPAPLVEEGWVWGKAVSFSREDPHPNPLPEGEGIDFLPLPLGEGRGEGRFDHRNQRMKRPCVWGRGQVREDLGAELPNLTPSRRSLEYRKSLRASRLHGSATPT